MMKNIISSLLCVAMMLVGTNVLTAQEVLTVKENAERIVKKLDAFFELSDEQEAKVLDIYVDKMTALDALGEEKGLSSEEMGQKTNAIKMDLDAAFRAVLTKKQLELLGPPKRSKSSR